MNEDETTTRVGPRSSAQPRRLVARAGGFKANSTSKGREKWIPGLSNIRELSALVYLPSMYRSYCSELMCI